MALESDLMLNSATFDTRSVSEKTKGLNEASVKAAEGKPKWFEVGAETYRQMRTRGETAFPKPIKLDDGSHIMIPSREEGREIHCRVFEPEIGDSQGVFLHIHAGGWVLFTEDEFDPFLKFASDTANLTMISIGYRLAPEHPFPQGPEDCFDVAEWLIDNAKAKFGAELKFIGGESAGAHLSLLTCFHLISTRPEFEVRALVLNYGCFDLSLSFPQMRHYTRPLVLTHVDMEHFVDALVPNTSQEQRRNPSISPFYANLREYAAKTNSGRLPPALFTIGTEDPLLDDTMLMSTKWLMSGAEAIVKVYAGAPHGFSLGPPSIFEASAEFRGHLIQFLKSY